MALVLPSRTKLIRLNTKSSFRRQSNTDRSSALQLRAATGIPISIHNLSSKIYSYQSIQSLLLVSGIQRRERARRKIYQIHLKMSTFDVEKYIPTINVSFLKLRTLELTLVFPCRVYFV